LKDKKSILVDFVIPILVIKYLEMAKKQEYIAITHHPLIGDQSCDKGLFTFSDAVINANV
jgi:hypothetical protein